MPGWTVTTRNLQRDIQATQNPHCCVSLDSGCEPEAVNAGQQRRNKVNQHNIGNALNSNLLSRLLCLSERGPILEQAAGLLEITSTETVQESTDWMAVGETLLLRTRILQLLTY